MTAAHFVEIPRELAERFDPSAAAPAAFSPPGSGQRLTAAHYAEALRAVAARPEEAVALYCHLPFCPVRCLYCACHTTITHDGSRIDRYLDGLEQEIRLVTDRLGVGRPLGQVHLGGGTPNYLTETQLIRLMGMLDRHFRIGPETFSNIECNPRRASAGQLDLLRGLGFKGISFGIQDLDARVQHAIGRINSLGLVRDVCATARDTGFECISLDLVYGLPNQTRQGFESTLERIVEMEPDRVRLFSYTHHPSTRPHQYAIEPGTLPGPRERLALLQSAVACLTDSGYHWIGLDNFVRHGDELADAQAAGRLRHTCLGYTCAPTRHLLGFGASSLGEVDGIYVQNDPHTDTWRKSLDAGGFPLLWAHRPGADERRRHQAMQQLLCNLELETRILETLPADYERLVRAADFGLVEIQPDRIRITPRGRFFLRTLCGQEDPNLSWSNEHWGAPHLM